MQDSDRNSGPPKPSRAARALDLAFVPDDEDDPTEITAYPDRGVDVTTAWLTMDADHVVDLAEFA